MVWENVFSLITELSSKYWINFVRRDADIINKSIDSSLSKFLISKTFGLTKGCEVMRNTIQGGY